MSITMDSKTPASRIAVIVLCLTCMAAADAPNGIEGVPLVVGLDHMPLAVRDLEAATERYRELGFTFKPGRPHDNGIRNAHIKFGDGTAIELITVDEPRDALAKEYQTLLSYGEGPAFISFFVPDLDRLAKYFDKTGRAYRRAQGLISFPMNDELRFIFFGQRQHSPTDRPEHFMHENGAESLIGAWIAENGQSKVQALLTDLGVPPGTETVHAPGAVKAGVARLPHGEVILLPSPRPLVPGRPVIGATIRVSNLILLQRVLARQAWNPLPVVKTSQGWSIFIAPELTHHIWLEFRQVR